MWGIDIGFGVTTWIAYSGFYALVAIALLFGDVRSGVFLMTSYWLGRVLPTVIGPLLLSSGPFVFRLEAIRKENKIVSMSMQIVGLLVLIAAAVTEWIARL